ncbi:MAG: hypothetical protein AAF915_06185 [Cyanobacteria bacterium P01_D01_bin.50]
MSAIIILQGSNVAVSTPRSPLEKIPQGTAYIFNLSEFTLVLKSGVTIFGLFLRLERGGRGGRFFS